MKIFNIYQANIMIKNNCKIIGCSKGNKDKIFIEFLEDENFNNVLDKWLNRKI